MYSPQQFVVFAIYCFFFRGFGTVFVDKKQKSPPQDELQNIMRPSPKNNKKSGNAGK